jgi:hypothetical protein
MNNIKMAIKGNVIILFMITPLHHPHRGCGVGCMEIVGLS